ncbi:MAG TPA: response regulator, partial [Phycisphaerae bacterium]|nr:response regulator [Phycisphaerae bacterium]
EAIEAAGRELVRLDADAVAEMDVGERLQLLEDKIARYSRELLHFDHFCVRVLDKQTCRLDPVVILGLPEEIDALELYALKEGNGITGYVAATGRSYLCADVTQDPHYLPGLENARSSLAVPLLLHDQVIGVLSAESERVKAFTEDDQRVAEIFGRSIAVALHTLQLLAVERHTTAGQIASDAVAELATPLRSILVQANALIEQYPDDDNVRQHSQAVVEGVERVKQALAAMSEQPAISGLVPEQTCKDPLLCGKRILVADDEDIIRETIADMLSHNGVLTATARNGEEAVELIRSQSFDLVLSDIKMPHKNGYEVFAVTRQVNSQCPVILITGFGYDPNHSIVRASKEGLAGVLFKPFKVEKLLEEVRHALGAPAN